MQKFLLFNVNMRLLLIHLNKTALADVLLSFDYLVKEEVDLRERSLE